MLEPYLSKNNFRNRLSSKIRLATLATLTLLAVSAFPLRSVSHAGEAEIVMRLLLKKGIITKTEYNEVMSELKGTMALDEKIHRHDKKITVLAQQQERITHEDKHIIHAREAPLTVIGNLSLGGGITLIGQGTSGNDKNISITPERDAIDGSISTDLEASASLGDHGEAFLLIEAGEGNGLEGEEITSFWGVNGDAGDSSSRLEATEAWYEHRFIEDRLILTVGKLDLTNYFDGNEVANIETIQFLSGGFVNSIAVEFPDNSAGARLTLYPNELFDISIAWQSGDGDWEDIFDNSFYMAEVDWKPAFRERKGNYRFYGWTNQTDHAELIGSKTDESGWGIGLSLDQQLTESLTFFTRIGYQDENIYKFDIAWSAGLAVAGSLWGRENDVLGVAYGMALLSDDYETDRKNNSINPGDETHFEAYYSFFINEHLTISPDLQIVTNAEGNDDFSTVWLGAIRGQLIF